MPISWALWAAFVSGLAWAGLDIARKSLTRDVTPAVVAAGLSLGLALAFGVWSALVPSTLTTTEYVPPAAVSIVLSVAIQLSILAALRRSDLSRSMPLLSLTPVATALFGLAILGEQPSPRQWTGIVLVFAGALALTLRGVRPSRLSLDGGSLLMLLAALCISAAAPFDKLAIAASSTQVHGFIQSACAAVVLLVYLAARGELSAVGGAFRRRPAMTVAAALVFAALALQFAAYRGTMVGMVETIKRVVGLVSAVAAGAVLFRERVTASKLAAVALMGIGVALMLV